MTKKISNFVFTVSILLLVNLVSSLSAQTVNKNNYSLVFALEKEETLREQVPLVLDRVSAISTLNEEHEISYYYSRILEGSEVSVRDSIINSYFSRKIQELALESNLKDRRLFVKVLADPEFNAFAVPGGLIGINYGLVKLASTESMFMSVMSHELAHISQRHFARGKLRTKDRSKLNALILAASVLGAFIGGPAGIASLAGGLGYLQESAYKFSRDNEAEADRIGFANLVKSGYAPDGMGEMFSVLADLERNAGLNEIPVFLRTHPLSIQRVVESSTRTLRLQKLIASELTVDSYSYQMMRARMQVLLENPRIVLDSYEAQLESFEETADQSLIPLQIGLEYGRIVALSKLSQTDEALQALAKLEQKLESSISLQATKLDILLAAGRMSTGLELADEYLKIAPNSALLLERKAKLLWSEQRFEEAKVALEQLKKNSPEPHILLLYMQLTKNMGLEVENLVATAEYLVATGQMEQALMQLHKAKRLTTNTYIFSESISHKIKDISDQIIRRNRLLK